MTAKELAAKIVDWLPIQGKAGNDYAREQIAAAIRNDREEMARLCDEQAQDVTGEWYGNEDYRRGAAKCAELIREIEKP